MSEVLLIVTTIVTVIVSLVTFIFSSISRVKKNERKEKLSKKDKPLQNVLKHYRENRKGEINFETDGEPPATYTAKHSEPLIAEDSMKKPFYITIVLMCFAFITMWLFYFRDGLNGASVAWTFGGPILGAVTGFWLSRSHKEK
jgi:O-antigen/teichoic acid export membrane protein